MEEKKEQVDHPSHYGGSENIYEAIKVIEAWNLDFHLGNAIKYLSRFQKKGDNAADYIQDLKKAVWYIERKIQMLEKNK